MSGLSRSTRVPLIQPDEGLSSRQMNDAVVSRTITAADVEQKPLAAPKQNLSCFAHLECVTFEVLRHSRMDDLHDLRLIQRCWRSICDVALGFRPLTAMGLRSCRPAN